LGYSNLSGLRPDGCDTVRPAGGRTASRAISLMVPRRSDTASKHERLCGRPGRFVLLSSCTSHAKLASNDLAWHEGTMPLPPGLSPVDAGRLGLWLLGQRNHRAAVKRRRPYRHRVYLSPPAARWARVAACWSVGSYPGAEVLISQLCDVSESTAKHWLRSHRDLPAHHARTLADYVEGFDGPAVARMLREYADARDKRLIKPVIGRKRVR
jgi:hypothetical protein